MPNPKTVFNGHVLRLTIYTGQNIWDFRSQYMLEYYSESPSTRHLNTGTIRILDNLMSSLSFQIVFLPFENQTKAIVYTNLDRFMQKGQKQSFC
jgi:hypothetical protein